MKMTKRLLAIVMAVVILVSVMSIVAEAASVSVKDLNLGYILPRNRKGTKTLSTITLYGDYDYINFCVKSKKDNSYFGYEIYADKNYTNLKGSGAIQCDKGTYNLPAEIKLKGNYSSRTYYLFTYAAKAYSDGSVSFDKNSFREYKIVVKRTASFDNKIVILKEAKNTTKGVTVSWSKLSGASKYYIYRRSLMGTTWTKVGATGSSKTSFTDTTAKNTGKYVYSVKGINKSGKASRYLYFGPTTIFAKAPTMKSIAVTYNNAIEIKWNSTSSKAKYNIMRKEDNGRWKTIETNYSGTSYKDTSVLSGKKYTYSVKAVIPTDYGNAISAYYYNSDKAVTYLRMPTLKEAIAVENGVKVSWYTVSGAEGYTILRKNSDGSTGWSFVGRMGANATSFVDTSADVETDYIYSVRSEASKNKGSYNRTGVEYIYVAPETLSSDEALAMYQNAAKEINTRGIAGYNKIGWQKNDKIEGLGILDNVITPILESFMTAEDEAEVKINAKGSDDAKNRMPISNCSKDSVKSVTAEKLSNGNYKVVIVMNDQVNPSYADEDGLGVMSKEFLDYKDVEVAAKDIAIVKSLDGQIEYKDYTITSEMTADGKFVSITHYGIGYIKANINVSINATGELEFNAKYTDFKY